MRDEGDRVFLHRRDEDDGWSPPSGTLQGGEKIGAALERADAAHRAVVARLGDLVRRVALARSEAEAEELRVEELGVHDELREASESAQKARVRFNREDRALGQRILAATAKAEGRA